MIALFVQAGGRCEFDGCNQYLLEHHVTKDAGNFAQQAHIVAYSSAGPRGAEGAKTADLNALANLMLLCPICHKLVDDNPEDWPVDTLRKFKIAHEGRVHMLTETAPERHTVGVVLKAKVGSSAVDVPFAQMQEAVAPRYLDRREICAIDLTTGSEIGSRAYWEVMGARIDEKLAELYRRSSENGRSQHFSVFAIGPIPLLVHLGSRMSNKIPTDLFQRHRDTQDWKWKEEVGATVFGRRLLRPGTDERAVALVLSISGQVSLADLDGRLDPTYSIYEIFPEDHSPSPTLLRTCADLRGFRDQYLETVRHLVAQHPGLTQIMLFPAVPAPVAVAVGFDLMPKRDPALVVFDYQDQRRGFVRTLEVNSRDQ